MTKPERSGAFIPVELPLPTPAGAPGRHACPRVCVWGGGVRGTRTSHGPLESDKEWGEGVLIRRHGAEREGLTDSGCKIDTTRSAESRRARDAGVGYKGGLCVGAAGGKAAGSAHTHPPPFPAST